MPTRRNPSNNTKHDSDNRITAFLVQRMTAVLLTIANRLRSTVDDEDNSDGETEPSHCTFRQFNSCQPLKFSGSEGEATGLFQWFENMEMTFLISKCQDHLRVRYATKTLQNRALAWWDKEGKSRGTEVALDLSWDEFKALMIEEFCPNNELQELEENYWSPLLLPHLTTSVNHAIRKFCNELPMQTRVSVLSSKPTTLEEAIQLTITTSDIHTKDGTLPTKGTKRPAEQTADAPSKIATRTKKRKTKNGYTGIYPLCDTCKYHHPVNSPCRQCTTCGRFGHLATTCRSIPRPKGKTQTIIRACFNCGDPNHM